MKVIFLDVDGVLNSMSYYEQVTDIFEEAIDQANVHELAKIVEATDAKIVLTSSWRGGWEKNPEECRVDGKLLVRELAKEGIEIFDKTGMSGLWERYGRSVEVITWMEECKQKYGEDIEAYVIIDDNDFDWEDYRLAEHWVHTDFNGPALDAKHRDQAIDILKNLENNFHKERKGLLWKLISKFKG